MSRWLATKGATYDRFDLNQSIQRPTRTRHHVYRKIALLLEPLLPNIARIADRSVDSREQGFIMQRLSESGYKRISGRW